MTPLVVHSNSIVPVLRTSRRRPFHHTVLNTDIVREAETKTGTVNIEYHVNMIRYIKAVPLQARGAQRVPGS